MNPIKSMILVMALIIALASCDQKQKKGYTVNGTIHGITEGTIKVAKSYNDSVPQEYEIKDGKFTFSGDPVKEPLLLFVSVKDKDIRMKFYIDNGIITVDSKVFEEEYDGVKYPRLEVDSVTGCIVNDHEKQIKDARKKLEKKYDIKNAPKEDQEKLWTKIKEERTEIMIQFIKDNPNVYYSGVLAERLSFGLNAKGIQGNLDLLDPKLNTKQVRRLKEQIQKMGATDVEASDLITAKNVTYKVEKAYKGFKSKGVSYLGVFSNDDVCALCYDGSVKVISGNGKILSGFKAEYPSSPSTMAVDNKDNIYVLYPIQKEVEKKYRGKVRKMKETLYYECAVFNRKGDKQTTLKLEGLKRATGARVADNKLMVADVKNRIIGVYDPKNGAKQATLEGMRPCCGILDFSINNKNEVLVANLGAFRVQAYDLTGKLLLTFGQRGKTIDDFHGCCNPVSVAFLSNGAIVTVEKDPTRVKVYSNDGTKQIEGIEELVKGCHYIPMIVDSKDNLYLASPKKGMVKCVAMS